ncbi:MAG: peptidase, partial [Proteobacteria bacterium]|nr:peptidase [Pseudomonadota bacterium]
MAWSRAVHRMHHRTRWACALLLAGLLGLSVAQADHDRARAALRAGEVLPLQVVLQRVQVEYPGRVLGIKLEREYGRWIYEVKLLDPSGRLNKL